MILVALIVGVLAFLLICVIAVVVHHERMKSFNQKVKEIHQQKLSSDELLKDGFSEKKIQDAGKFDCIIIGSGMGGLSTGALLSRLGKRVLLLEQHDIIGGCTHTFVEKGFEFDTGVHYLGHEVTKSNSTFGFIFHLLGMGKIKWSKMDKVYDRAAISPLLSSQLASSSSKVTSVDFSDNLEETIQRIKKQFPGEENAIDTYFRLVKWCHLAFPVYIMIRMLPKWINVVAKRLFRPFLSTFFEKTTREILSGLTRNEELIGVLTYLWGDYGLPPSRSAFVMNGLLLDHFAQGGYYPTGGSSVFAESFLPTILAGGGRALVRAPVSQILLSADGCKAIGVTVKGNNIYAPIVVSACGVLRTFSTLIPSDIHCPFAARVRKSLYCSLPSKSQQRKDLTSLELCHSTYFPPSDQVAPSLSMFSLFVGINGSKTELGLPATNLWLFADWNHDKMVDENLSSTREVTLMICNEENPPTGKHQLRPFLPMTFIGSASAKDESWAKRYPDKCVLEIITAADYSCYWEAARNDKNDKPKHRGEIYNMMKKQTQDFLLDIVYEQFPQLKGKVAFVDSGTPLTNNFYIGSLNGEVYGLEHSVARFNSCEWFLHNQTPIKGLYLSGQDTLVDGIVGALGSGVLCAMTINPYVLFDLIATYIIEEI